MKGAIDYVPEYKRVQVKRLLLVHGTVSWEKRNQNYSFRRCVFGNFYHRYTGECSYYGAGLIADLVEELAIDFILGLAAGS